MLKNMECIMAEEMYESSMMGLYERMKCMQKDIETIKRELDDFNKLYDEHKEQLKVSIKAEQVKVEPATKKAKIVSLVKKSVFSGTPLDTSSSSCSFITPSVNPELK
jgi:hypothetical protein